MKKLIIACLMFSVGILIQNCKTEVGPVGPAGPAGTANVIYSDWANVTFTGSGTSWSGSITAPKITQEILDKGVVKTYFKFGSSVYEGNYTNVPTGAAIYVYLSVGTITIKSTFSASYPWRYVIIPGGVAAGRRANIDYSNYEEVKEIYNIPD